MSTILRGSDNLDSGDIVKDSTCETDIALYNKGFKNYIMNGNFDIWQYGPSQTTLGYGSDDRWFNYNRDSTKTHSRQTCTDTERVLFNAQYYSRTVVSSVAGASNIVYKLQYIEDVTKLAGKTVTLSFWARADSTKNFAVEFAQNFGTGGTPTYQVNRLGSQLVPLTSTWQKFTKTVTLPSIVGKTIGTDGVHTSSTQITFYFDDAVTPNRSSGLGQQSGTFDIAQVQLEEGSVATPFENRPIGLELSLCQRYYNGAIKVGLYNSASSTLVIGGSATFSPPMRVTPTMGLVAGIAVNYQNLSANGTEYYSTVGAGLWNNGFHYAAAEL